MLMKKLRIVIMLLVAGLQGSFLEAMTAAICTPKTLVQTIKDALENSDEFMHTRLYRYNEVAEKYEDVGNLHSLTPADEEAMQAGDYRFVSQTVSDNNGVLRDVIIIVRSEDADKSNLILLSGGSLTY